MWLHSGAEEPGNETISHLYARQKKNAWIPIVQRNHEKTLKTQQNYSQLYNTNKKGIHKQQYTVA